MLEIPPGVCIDLLIFFQTPGELDVLLLQRASIGILRKPLIRFLATNFLHSSVEEAVCPQSEFVLGELRLPKFYKNQNVCLFSDIVVSDGKSSLRQVLSFLPNYLDNFRVLFSIEPTKSYIIYTSSR